MKKISRLLFGCFAVAACASSSLVAFGQDGAMSKPSMEMMSKSMMFKQVGDGVCVMPDKTPSDANKYYEVTLKNITRGQIFSPPLFVTHSAGQKVWTEGEMPDPGVIQLCETGLNSNIAGDLRKKGASDVVICPLPVTPGASCKIYIRAKSDDVISALTMLVFTNDGFTGLSNCALQNAQFPTMAYDVGHEDNNEKTSYIPGKLGTESAVTKHRTPIMLHAGIKGVGDLDKAEVGWDGPVATFTIREVADPMSMSSKEK